MNIGGAFGVVWGGKCVGGVVVLGGFGVERSCKSDWRGRKVTGEELAPSATKKKRHETTKKP